MQIICTYQRNVAALKFNGGYNFDNFGNTYTPKLYLWGREGSNVGRDRRPQPSPRHWLNFILQDKCTNFLGNGVGSEPTKWSTSTMLNTRRTPHECAANPVHGTQAGARHEIFLWLLFVCRHQSSVRERSSEIERSPCLEMRAISWSFASTRGFWLDVTHAMNVCQLWENGEEMVFSRKRYNSAWIVFCVNKICTLVWRD